MKTYRTAEVANRVGVHPNTVRFYEEQGLLPVIPRENNGYRVFSDHHILQLRVIRAAFRAEILSNNLRGEAISIVKTAARSEHSLALEQTQQYREHLDGEIKRAQEAIALTEHILETTSSGEHDKSILQSGTPLIGRREAAEQLNVSIDVLRDWERNGLIEIPRKGNRRQYGTWQMNQLKIIALLRQANYSQMAIRRMMVQLERGSINVGSALDTPGENEDIVSVADRYITSLKGALCDADEMVELLELMEKHH